MYVLPQEIVLTYFQIVLNSWESQILVFICRSGMVTHPCVQLTFIEQSFPVALLRVYQKRYEQTKPATKFMKKKILPVFSC